MVLVAAKRGEDGAAATGGECGDLPRIGGGEPKAGGAAGKKKAVGIERYPLFVPRLKTLSALSPYEFPEEERP